MARTGRHRRPLICGYYGEHNLGDDALLEVLLGSLPPETEPLVTAHDEPWVRRRFGVDTCNRRSLMEVMGALRSCDALLLGGGSLLQDATSFQSLVYYILLMLTARLQGKPVLLWGQGLGPLRRPISRLLVRGALPLASAISWRDEASALLARRLGSRNHAVGSDPVWGYPQRPWRGAKGPIVLCWRPLKSLDPNGWHPYLEALTAVAERSGRELVWLPFHRMQDRHLLQRLQQVGPVPKLLLERSREVEVADPNEAMTLFSEAGLVVAMRLHGLILAALAGSPVAALSYDPKVAAVARSLGCPLQDLETPPREQLADEWLQQLDQAPPEAPIQALRQQAAVHRGTLHQGMAEPG
ncbi:MAG: polysaccharide pyruvyl transferase CsaB [Cyanobacteriota bacterium]|nr:polysaccharide pyruvyl transferase CsaB [Cyanobacteriota bacterium]